MFLDTGTGPQWSPTLFLLFLVLVLLLLSDLQSAKAFYFITDRRQLRIHIGDNISHNRTVTDFQV